MHRELEEELVSVFRETLRAGAFVGGPQVEAFEEEFAAYCGTKYCIGVSSGTDALRFALMAVGVGDGDAVVTVAHTFVATAEAISQAGAAIELVDVDPRTGTMCPEALAAFLAACERDPRSGRPLGQRTRRPIRAVVPVHLYGQVADMDAILAVAREHRLLVVEDACQAHGAEYRSGDGGWRRAGSLGRAAAFSFYPGKNLGACGEAGALTTDDGEVAAMARMLRDHGQTRKYHHVIEGYNGRLDALQAAILRIKLRRLDGWNTRRRAAAARYAAALADVPSLRAPEEPSYARGNYHLYVVRVQERDALAEYLSSQGVQTGQHYPVPVHLQPGYRGLGYAAGSLPVTETLASQVLSLPMCPSLTAAQQERVSAAIDTFAGEAVHAGAVEERP